MSKTPFFTEEEFKELQVEIDGGWINVNKHPEFDLWIYNYSKSTQYSWRWNKYTSQCRGLILDANGCLVAKGFDKFFTDDQLKSEGLEDTIPKGEPFDLYEKVDGSLGVMYFWEGVPYMSTRGSFVSDMAIEANKWLRTKYKDIYFNPNYSYNFEIIYPENRIVVDYGDKRELVLLAVMENDTRKERRIYGEEFDDVVDKTGIKRVKIYNSIEDWKDVYRLFKDEKNFEGFVVHFLRSNFRVKMKLDWYKQISYVMQNFTKKTIWKMFRDGKDVEAIVADIDDEFYPMVKVFVEELTSEYNALKCKYDTIYEWFANFLSAEYPFGYTTKDFAVELKNYSSFEDFGVIMSMYNKKDISQILWRRLEPKASELDSES